MIEVVKIIVTPLREYLEISSDQIHGFELQDEKPAFANYRALNWYLHNTSELFKQIETAATKQGAVLRIEKRQLPRFHETSWQLSNNIEECK